MGNFFDLDAWREQQRIAGINRKITDLQGDIEDYETAKQEVETAKTDCGSEKDDWQETSGKMSGRQVKKTGTFEGEMAESLEGYISDAEEENITAIGKAESLVSCLETQIDAIDTRISELNSEIISLRNQI